MSEGEWASKEPDVLLPVEEVWPVAMSVPNDDTLAHAIPLSSGQAGERLGVEQPLSGYSVIG